MKQDPVTHRVRQAADRLVRLSGATWYYITATARKALEDDILFLTSGLAFNIVLSLVPILLLSASAFGIILNSSTETVKRLNEFLNVMVPAQPYLRASGNLCSVLCRISWLIEGRLVYSASGCSCLLRRRSSMQSGAC